MQDTPITISPRDAAGITNLSERTIGRLIAAGRIRSTKIGRRRLIYRDSVLELLGVDG